MEPLRDPPFFKSFSNLACDIFYQCISKMPNYTDILQIEPFLWAFGKGAGHLNVLSVLAVLHLAMQSSRNYQNKMIKLDNFNIDWCLNDYSWKLLWTMTWETGCHGNHEVKYPMFWEDLTPKIMLIHRNSAIFFNLYKTLDLFMPFTSFSVELIIILHILIGLWTISWLFSRSFMGYQAGTNSCSLRLAMHSLYSTLQ